MGILQRYDNDGVELVINTQTGEAFATQAGYSRMSGINYATIRKRIERLKGGDETLLKTAEIQTEGGIQGVTLIPEDLIVEWLPGDNPAMASQLMKLGIRVFLHKMAGYEVVTTATQPEKSRHDMVDYVKAAAILPTLKVNAHLKALLEDGLTDEIELMRNQKLLGGDKRQYTIVKVRAKELGYPVDEVGGGSGLGNYVAKHMDCALVERVGKFQVKHYEVSPMLDEVIHSYFR